MLISVIIPIYNVSKYLGRCIESVLNQTYTDIEIILVDDGSTDGSGKICDEYSDKDSRVSVIHKENGGLSDARNCGIMSAQGSYICFVDSDDFIHPHMIQRLKEVADETNADITICGFHWIEEDDINEAINDTNLSGHQVFVGDNIIRQLWDNNLETVVAWNKLYKRGIFKNIRYPIGKIHEDEYVIHQLLWMSSKTAYIEDKLYYYMKHGDSITANPNAKSILDAVDAFYERSNFFKKRNMEMYKRSLRSYWDFTRGKYNSETVINEKERNLLKKRLVSTLIPLILHRIVSKKEVIGFILMRR